MRCCLVVHEPCGCTPLFRRLGLLFVAFWQCVFFAPHLGFSVAFCLVFERRGALLGLQGRLWVVVSVRRPVPCCWRKG